jgi:hypothetical protein
MRSVIVDPALPQKIKGELTELGFSLLEVRTDLYPGLTSAWKGHPDIHFARIKNTLFHDPFSRVIAEKILSSGLIQECVCCEKIPSSPYPSDCSYNVLTCGDYAFHNFEYTDPVVKRALERDFTCVNIGQGYANCSSIVLQDGKTGKFMIASSDKGVLAAVEQNNIGTFYADNTGIIIGNQTDLNRMTGFWGGCSGICGDTIFFTGNPATAKEGSRLMAWISSRGYKIVMLSQGPCIDTGSLLFCA